MAMVTQMPLQSLLSAGPCSTHGSWSATLPDGACQVPHSASGLLSAVPQALLHVAVLSVSW